MDHRVRFEKGSKGFRYICNKGCKNLSVVVLLTLCLAGLGGCGGPGQGETPEDRVRERAQAWGDALLRKDLEAAFALTSPSYREFAEEGHYHARIAGAGNWTSAEVDRVTCTPDFCDVRMIVEYEIKHMKVKNRRPLDYRWTEVDGQWWLYVPLR